MFRQSFKSSSWLLASVLGVLSSVAMAGDIVMALEEPAPDQTYTGIGGVRGWVVGSAGIDRVEWYLNSQFKGYLPMGGTRTDVGNVYPNYPDSSNSGFSIALNYSGLNSGNNQMTVVAVDHDGHSKEISIIFKSDGFDNSFISDDSKINLDNAILSRNGKKIIIQNVIADNKIYDIQLNWRTAIQNYTIEQISYKSDIDDDDDSPGGVLPPYPTPSQCGSKRTCGEMSSCSEARYYLNQCKVTSLDSDKDGIPCESLCK